MLEGERPQRIPAALQQVFLQSNRGKEVDKPPPNSAANKVFQENWAHQKASCAVSLTSSSKRSAPPPKSSRKTTEQFPNARTGRDRTRRAPAKRQRSLTGLSPQQHLEGLLKKRGYEVTTYRTLKTGYYNASTKLQMASYGPHMVDLVRRGDAESLRSYVRAGLSPNPCNLFGESLIHTICRRGDLESLKAMLEEGASVQVSDDFGRTPLHDGCWAAEPALDLVELLIQQDPRLFFMKDKRGALPLSYVTRDYWYLWRQFLDRIIDIYYPADKADKWAKTRKQLCSMEPNSCPLEESKLPLPLELVSLVSSGRVSLREAQYMAKSGAWNKIKNNPNSALDDSEYEDTDDDEDNDSELDDSDLSSDEELDEYEIQDQVSSMMDMVRAWDKK